MSEDSGFRELLPQERALILHLLEVPFEGHDQFRSQLETARVRLSPGCVQHGCGSLDIDVGSTAPTAGGRRMGILPVEARYTDEDGLPVDVLLFQANGKLSYLEFVIYGPRPRQRFPHLEELDVYHRRTGSEPVPL